MGTALVTGASGGIGLELARQHAMRGGDRIVVARSGNRLKSLKGEFEEKYKVRVESFTLDLAQPEAPRLLFEHTSRLQVKIDVLINNAGIGTFGLFHETTWDQTATMIDLNMRALTHLTRLYLPDMVERKQGSILNVASTAAFQPGPTMAVYFASKAYVLHFSEALAEELRGTGVTVTALCPGATESGFKDAAKMDESKLFRGRKLPASAAVAEYGYRAMTKGSRVAVHGFMNSLMVNSVRLVPRVLAARVAGWMTAGN